MITPQVKMMWDILILVGDPHSAETTPNIKYGDLANDAIGESYFGCPDNACIDPKEDYGYQQMVLKTQLVFQMVSMGLKHERDKKEWHIEYFNLLSVLK